eukprot:gene37529-45579_t
MAEATMISPSEHLGKRRSEFDEASVATDLTNTFSQSFKKIRIRGFDSPQQGEFSFQGPENLCPQSSSAPSNTAHFASPGKTRSEYGAHDKPVQSVQQYWEQQVKYLESQLTSARAEHALQMQRKTQEITELSTAKLTLSAQIQKLTKENESSVQEAKILKRAVTIQDSRYKELLAHSQQLEQCLQLALSKIEELDHANRALRCELDVSQQGHYGDYTPPPPPPDVY